MNYLQCVNIILFLYCSFQLDLLVVYQPLDLLVVYQPLDLSLLLSIVTIHYPWILKIHQDIMQEVLYIRIRYDYNYLFTSLFLHGCLRGKNVLETFIQFNFICNITSNRRDIFSFFCLVLLQVSLLDLRINLQCSFHLLRILSVPL